MTKRSNESKLNEITASPYVFLFMLTLVVNKNV